MWPTPRRTMGYDGTLDRKVCKRGFDYANEIIDRCAKLLLAMVPA